jgi:hypothetical protein
MNDKQGLEDFRHRQFALPHPGLTHHGALHTSTAATKDLNGADIVPDVDRVVIHFDVDCFYAQVCLYWLLLFWCLRGCSLAKRRTVF